MKTMRRLTISAGCLTALLMLTAAPARAQTAPPQTAAVEGASDAEGYGRVTVGEHFSCVVPPGWSRSGAAPFGLSNEEKKAYGITLNGPWRGEIPVKISVFYYAPGNLLYQSVDHYLRVQSRPALGVALEGSSYGEVGPLAVSGRAGMVFERSKNEYVPMQNTIGPLDKPNGREGIVYERREMMARAVPVRERFVVLPAQQGFYALRYTAAAENFEEFLPLFDKVTASFEARHL